MLMLVCSALALVFITGRGGTKALVQNESQVENISERENEDDLTVKLDGNQQTSQALPKPTNSYDNHGSTMYVNSSYNWYSNVYGGYVINQSYTSYYVGSNYHTDGTSNVSLNSTLEGGQSIVGIDSYYRCYKDCDEHDYINGCWHWQNTKILR